MTIFADYAQYYDLIYNDKDYQAECDYLEIIFSQHESPVRNILDLGCGTGGHAIELCRRGYLVTGVDFSREMLDHAKKKAATLAVTEAPRFIQGDIRTIELDQKFDAVIAMFAVISYMTTNNDLVRVFTTARNHLDTGGIFTFDAWFGPAVLSQKPFDRYKIINERDGKVIRFAHPILDPVKQTVSVEYKILHITNEKIILENDETHIMRFLFCQELTMMMRQAHFNDLHFNPYMNLDSPLTESDWNLSVIARAD